MKLKQFFVVALLVSSSSVMAQYGWQQGEKAADLDLKRGLGYEVEMQGSYSKDNTPLWLNANKFGLSSLKGKNGYVRGKLIRPLSTDSLRRWGVGYGLDVAVPVNYTSNVVIQQAFVEGRWLHGTLSIGSKEYPMELKNNLLSSGSQTLGINARPVPQVRLALPEYWTIPALGRWFHLKGHIAYGKYTDDGWQEEFTQKRQKYTNGALYHSKAGYLKIGSEERFNPLSLEMGLEMACQFGGTTYYERDANGDLIGHKAGSGLKDMWHAFLPGGQDASDGAYGNIEGNQLGSWVFRVNYETEGWTAHIYGDHFFEDHSAMLFFDYDGYDSGENYNVKKDFRFFRYKLKDMLLGAELNLVTGRWIKDFVFEYIYTKYQSGPFNHDHTMNIPNHQAGVDEYYNHGNYTGWQHWGQVMGNPLYRSPLYNEDGQIRIKDNRFWGFHLGFDGQPFEKLNYRVLATWQEGLGTYTDPYTHFHHNFSFMVEAAYQLKQNWKVKGAYGMDFGHILGLNAGFQLTVSKSGLLKL